MPLRSRKPSPPIEHRSAELMQTRVCQLHLGLDAFGPDDGQVRRRVDHVLQQRRLADPRLTAQQQRATVTLADRRDQLVESLALRDPSPQARVAYRSRRTVLGVVAIRLRATRPSFEAKVHKKTFSPTPLGGGPATRGTPFGASTGSSAAHAARLHVIVARIVS